VAYAVDVIGFHLDCTLWILDVTGAHRALTSLLT